MARFDYTGGDLTGSRFAPMSATDQPSAFGPGSPYFAAPVVSPISTPTFSQAQLISGDPFGKTVSDYIAGANTALGAQQASQTTALNEAGAQSGVLTSPIFNTQQSQLNSLFKGAQSQVASNADMLNQSLLAAQADAKAQANTQQAIASQNVSANAARQQQAAAATQAQQSAADAVAAQVAQQNMLYAQALAASKPPPAAPAPAPPPANLPAYAGTGAGVSSSTYGPPAPKPAGAAPTAQPAAQTVFYGKSSPGGASVAPRPTTSAPAPASTIRGPSPTSASIVSDAGSPVGTAGIIYNGIAPSSDYVQIDPMNYTLRPGLVRPTNTAPAVQMTYTPQGTLAPATPSRFSQTVIG